MTDADGYDVTVKEISPTEYIFKMPASKVTVEAEFVKTPETSTLPYNDVDVDDWFYGAAEYAYNNGIMSGMGATQFAPNINLSRAMLAQILYNMESGTPVSSAQFADVVAGAWYADAVNWAAANGTVGGYGDGISGPEINISREQIAVILYRYASYKGYNVSTKGDLSAFTDIDKLSDWAEEAVAWVVGENVFGGKGKGVLDPTGLATRAEVAQIFMNFCENIDK